MVSTVRLTGPVRRTAAEVRRGARAVRRAATGVPRWWRSRSRRQAHLLAVTLACVSLLSGVGASALVVGGGPEGPRAGFGPPVPGATALGPVSLVLPEELGPWARVPDARMDGVREAASGEGPVLEGAWGMIGPDGLLVTVVTARAGDHSGIGGLLGPFDEGAVDVPWRGGAPHAAGAQVVDGVREVVLAVEHPGGDLVLLSVSGPEGAFDSGALEDALVTVRVEP